MQSLQAARTSADQVRQELSSAGHVVEWGTLVEYCERVHKFEVVKVATVFLDGAKGDVNTADSLIRIDATLGAEAALATLAHELGHLKLHAARLDDPTDTVNPIMASVYSERDGIGVARYSPRMREEIEAEAFATSLLCPAKEALAYWIAESAATCESVAAHYGVSTETAEAQLASALYLRSLGEPAVASARPLVEPDEDQLAAIQHSAHHALVDAGPGTGKTATLVHRARHLVEKEGVAPAHVLIVTFSNQAAEEIRGRLTATIGAVAAQMTIGTFHAFGAQLLHHYHAEVGRNSNFAVLDEEAQLDFISHLVGRPEARALVNIRDMEGSVERIAKLCDFCSGRLVTADALDYAVAAWSSGDGDEVAYKKALAFAAFYRTYEHEKAEANVVDFSDLIRLPVELLQAGGEPRHTIQATYQHVLVDEFQDVTPSTAQLIEEISNEYTPVWVVGDPRQAIYRFLGASAENVTLFRDRFPKADLYSLRTNYRAEPEIVAAANQLATLLETPGASAVDEKWRSARAPATGLPGPPISVAVADSDIAEAQYIVAETQRLLAAGVPPEEIAILTRRNEDVRRIALLLAAADVEVSANNLLSPEGLAGDLVALASLTDDRSMASALRAAIAVARGRLSAPETNELVNEVLRGQAVNGPSKVAQSRELLNGMLAIAEKSRYDADAFELLCRLLFDSSAILRPLLTQPQSARTRLQLSEIASVLALAIAFRAGSREEPRPQARIRFAASARKRLVKGRPAPVAPEPTPGAVRIMTCHAAKGLEFPFVIVAGQSARAGNDNFPELPRLFRPPAGDESAQADALLFVAVTRAQRSVLVARAKSSRGTNGGRLREPVALLSAWETMRAASPIPISTPTTVRDASVAVPWTVDAISQLNVSTLVSSDCGLQRYLEGVWKLRFPVASPSPYPAFISALRRSIELMLCRTTAAGTRLDGVSAIACFDEAWSSMSVDDHAHNEMYQSIGRALLAALSQQFPLSSPVFKLEPDTPIVMIDGRALVRLGLVGTIVMADGRRIVVGITTADIETANSATSTNWSALKDERTLLALSLASSVTRADERVVVSVPRLAAYKHNNSKQRDSLAKKVRSAEDEIHGLLRGVTSTEPSQCDRCRVRLVCPSLLHLAAQEASCD